MPEFLINYRNCTTGDLVNVHVVNVDDLNHAISIADNSLLGDDGYDYDSAYMLCDRASNSTGIPF